MNESDYNELLEISWRRKLSAQEESRLHQYFAEHAQAQRQWDEETNLSQCLESLPDKQLPSNFNALVWQAVQRESAGAVSAHEPRGWRVWTKQWVPRTVLAVLIVSFGLLAYQEYERRTFVQRAQDAAEIAKLAAALPNAELWQDFDVINRANSDSLAADEALWAALK